MYDYNLGIRFEAVVKERAEQSAIWFGDREQISYGALNRLSNQTARWLLDHHVSTGDAVCLSGCKSPQTFAGMIACLKIGAIYSVLDPDSPVERLRKILSTCKPRLLLGERDFLNRIEPVAADLGIEVADQSSKSVAEAVERYDDLNLTQTRAVTGASPAYIMFTSGSTGFPKGAVMTHDNVLNLIAWSRETFRITPEDILTNVNPLYFDNAVFDFYSALFTGARLVPFSKEEVKDPKRLVEKVDTSGCTLWFSVPSLLIFLQTMKATDGKHLRSIRRFVFGGEGYPKAKLKGLFDTYSETSELFNVYGPTECTCICSCYQITVRDLDDLQGLPPLGQIANNFSFMILDEDNQAVSAGDTGELGLLGPNVGKGYYNDAVRTAASFVQNPYNDSFAEVMYKTGDLVKLDPADGKRTNAMRIACRYDSSIGHHHQ